MKFVWSALQSWELYPAYRGVLKNEKKMMMDADVGIDDSAVLLRTLVADYQ